METAVNHEEREDTNRLSPLPFSQSLPHVPTAIDACGRSLVRNMRVHSTLAPKKYIMKREVAPESVDRKEHSCWLARTFMKEKIMGEPTEVLSPAPVRWPAA